MGARVGAGRAAQPGHRAVGVRLAAAIVAWLLATAPSWARAAAEPAAVDAGSIQLPPRSASNLTSPRVAVDANEKASLDQRFRPLLERKLGLLGALDRLDQRAEEIETTLARVGARRADAVDALRDAESHRARAERRLDDMRAAVRARLRTVLRLQRDPSLRFLSAPSAFGSSVVQERLLRRLLEGDRDRLQAYRDQLATLTSQTAARDAALRELDASDRALHGQLAELERARHDKMALVAQIETDPRYLAMAERDLSSVDAALVEQLKALEEWRERGYAFGRTRGKLLRPVNMSRVEIPFGVRKHPRFGTETFHRGVTLRPAEGRAAVRALFWGRVAWVGWVTGLGHTVILDHGRGWHSVYAHLEDIAVGQGEVVRSRQRLANVGSSGSRLGRVLYVEIREHGVPIDPLAFFR